MITLIENGEVYGPDPRGESDVLILGGKIVKVGRVERGKVEAIGVGRLVTQGRLNVDEPFVKQSTRNVSLHGQKHEPDRPDHSLLE